MDATTALHEAAHAVQALILFGPSAVNYVAIGDAARPGSAGGVELQPLTPEMLDVAKGLAVPNDDLYTGFCGLRNAGFEVDEMVSKLLQVFVAGHLAEAFAAHQGFDETAFKGTQDHANAVRYLEGVGIYSAYHRAAINDAVHAVRKRFRDPATWAGITRLAGSLYRRGRLTGPEAAEIVAKAYHSARQPVPFAEGATIATGPDLNALPEIGGGFPYGEAERRRLLALSGSAFNSEFAKMVTACGEWLSKVDLADHERNADQEPTDPCEAMLRDLEASVEVLKGSMSHVR